MVIEVKPYKEESTDIEHITTRVFFKTLELLGGIKKLAEYRALTWLPSLARASYVVVLKENFFKTEEEIAKMVGLTKNTVRNILRADPETALRKIQEYDTEEIQKGIKVHTAGAIAKLAYEEIKKGKECELLLKFAGNMMEETAKVLDVPWAYTVLKHTKGVRYPIEQKDDLMEHLKGLTIKGVKAEDLLDKLSYPIPNPAKLLHEIKEIISKDSKES